MKTILWDAHMHTSFSDDSTAAPKDMIQKAAACGLSGITITDHLDLEYPDDPSLFLLPLPEYAEAIRQLAGCTDNFTVRFGIELGLAPRLAAELEKITAAWPFDFVIGSSHVVHGTDPYYPSYYEGRTVSEAYREYFESILENILAWDGFDVYGHLDYVVRYGPADAPAYDWKEYADVIDAILKELIARGKGIEINTAGLKYGLAHPNPTEGILARYHELGGEIITIGSDAHEPAHIAYAFDRVPEILKQAGFRSYCVFRNREPEFISI